MTNLTERLQYHINKIKEEYEPLIIPKHNKGAGYRKNPAWKYGDPNSKVDKDFPSRSLIRIIQDNKNSPIIKKILNKENNEWVIDLENILRGDNKTFLESKFLQYCIIRALSLDKYNRFNKDFNFEKISLYEARNEIVEFAKSIISLYNDSRDNRRANYLDSLKEYPELVNNKQVKNLLKRGVNPRDIIITWDELDDDFQIEYQSIVDAIAFASLCNVPDLVKDLKSDRTIIKAMKIMEYLVYGG